MGWDVPEPRYTRLCHGHIGVQTLCDSVRDDRLALLLQQLDQPLLLDHQGADIGAFTVNERNNLALLICRGNSDWKISKMVSTQRLNGRLGTAILYDIKELLSQIVIEKSTGNGFEFSHDVHALMARERPVDVVEDAANGAVARGQNRLARVCMGVNTLNGLRSDKEREPSAFHGVLCVPASSLDLANILHAQYRPMLRHISQPVHTGRLVSVVSLPPHDEISAIIATILSVTTSSSASICSRGRGGLNT
jgi:hypothetical protein